MIRLFTKMSTLSLSKLRKRSPVKTEKPKKKIVRFDGLSEEEIQQKYTLPDILAPNLDLIFVGINPSLMAAYRGRYYAGPGNHFYKLLHVSELVTEIVDFEQDYKLLEYKIGLTNIVTRPTRTSADLKKSEIKEGANIVEEKIKILKPKIVVFNGKCIYEVYAKKTSKHDFNFGLQSESIGETAIWVVPSSSARCSNFPRMVDKLHFYIALKKYLSYLKGEIMNVDENEFKFEGKCKPSIPSTSKMWRRKNMSAFYSGGRVANKDTFCMDMSGENIAIANSTEFVVNNYNEEKIEMEKKTKETVDNSENVVTNIEVKCELDTKKRKFSLSSTTSTTGKKQKNKNNLKQLTSTLNSTKESKKRSRSSNFISLIKQRLAEKQTTEKHSETKDEGENHFHKETRYKKLNYANLKSNRCKRNFETVVFTQNDNLYDSILNN